MFLNTDLRDNNVKYFAQEKGWVFQTREVI